MYIDIDQEKSKISAKGNSFDPKFETKIKYNEFTEKMNKNSFSVAMKDQVVGMQKLRDDITGPNILKDISELKSIDIISG